MLTDNLDRIHLKRKHAPRHVSEKRRFWADEQKLEAVKLWLEKGSIAVVSKKLQIPYYTILDWKETTWWKECVDELQNEGRIVLSNKLKRIIEKALLATEERLDNGDYVLNQKTGEQERKPVSIRDTHRAAVDLLKHQYELDKKPIEAISNQQITAQLQLIAAQFAKMTSQQKTPQITVTDVIFGEETDAVYDQNGETTRESGSQEPSRQDFLQVTVT